MSWLWNIPEAFWVGFLVVIGIYVAEALIAGLIQLACFLASQSKDEGVDL